MARYDPDRYHRRSIRLDGYDYRRAGAYFVTICVQEKACLLGDVVDGCVLSSDAGKLVRAIWEEMPEHYSGVELDAFVVMPNHLHGIILLTALGDATETPGHEGLDSKDKPRAATGKMALRLGLSLAEVVHRFKSLTTSRYRDGVVRLGWQPFPARLWQRNYYEHVIRDEESLERIRFYIADNPSRWAEDPEHPDHL